LIGEYVVEILQLIEQNLPDLDRLTFRQFAEENPQFLATTRRRVASYWDCYYRHIPKNDYVGFRLLNYLDSLAGLEESVHPPPG